MRIGKSWGIVTKLSTSVLLGCLLLGACSRRPTREPPKTYPVSGEVVGVDGKAVAGAMIQFTPSSEEFRSQAVTDPRGQFRLRLLFNNDQLDGAIEGVHRVTVYFPPDKLPADGAPMKQLKEPLEVKPSENHFSINLSPEK